MPNNQDRAKHEDQREQVTDTDADALTIRAVYDRVATIRAEGMRHVRECEKIMDWLKRKK